MTMQPGLVLDPGTFWLRRATHGEALAPQQWCALLCWRQRLRRECVHYWRPYPEPDGIESRKEQQRQHRAGGCAADQGTGHRSPKHRGRERNECQYCRKSRQEDRSRACTVASTTAS